MHLHRGKIYEKIKDYDEAKESYNLAIKANSDPDAVKIASESLELLSEKK
ncbi:MAG: tetratricopeptide repeat protein [Candidatus Riflebacteria bacterium]